MASYTYYSNGLRQTKTVGSTTYTYYYDQNNNLIRVVDNTGKVLWRITWGNGKPMFLTNAAGTIYYYVTNYRGDVVQIVDASGNKVADYSYNPWGNVLSSNESACVPSEGYIWRNWQGQEKGNMTFFILITDVVVLGCITLSVGIRQGKK